MEETMKDGEGLGGVITQTVMLKSKPVWKCVRNETLRKLVNSMSHDWYRFVVQ